MAPLLLGLSSAGLIRSLPRDKALAEGGVPACGRHPAVEVDKQRQFGLPSGRPGLGWALVISLRFLEPFRGLVVCRSSSSLMRMPFAEAWPPRWPKHRVLTIGRPPTCFVGPRSGGIMLLNFGIKLLNCAGRRLPGLQARLASSGRTAPKLVRLPFSPVIWRAGARLLNEQLHGWVRSWCQSFDCGGLAETSVATALQQLQHELDHHACGAIQQDIAGFFDSLDHKLMAQVLRHLRASASLVALVEHVWATGRRLFSLGGSFGHGLAVPWARTTPGVSS